MKKNKSEFGKRLTYYRKVKGLTQAELGKKVGVSTGSLRIMKAKSNIRRPA